MRYTAVAMIAVGLGVGQAVAADLPRAAAHKAPPVALYNFTGCYVGGHGGYHNDDDKFSSTASLANFPGGAAAFLDRTYPGTTRPMGYLAGVQGGCNLQYGSVVIGAEADASWMGGTADRSFVITNAAGVPPGLVNAAVNNISEARFLSTVRGRIGWAFDNVLLYATGGAAFGTIHTIDTLRVAGVTRTADISSRRSGWTVGAGIEFAFLDNWLVRGEYLYVDLGTLDSPVACVGACADPTDLTAHHKYTENIIRLGLSYKFGGPIVARY